MQPPITTAPPNYRGNRHSNSPLLQGAIAASNYNSTPNCVSIRRSNSPFLQGAIAAFNCNSTPKLPWQLPLQLSQSGSLGTARTQLAPAPVAAAAPAAENPCLCVCMRACVCLYMCVCARSFVCMHVRACAKPCTPEKKDRIETNLAVHFTHSHTRTHNTHIHIGTTDIHTNNRIYLVPPLAAACLC